MSIFLGCFLLVRGVKQLLSNTFNKSEDFNGTYTLLGKKEEKERLAMGRAKTMPYGE